MGNVQDPRRSGGTGGGTGRRRGVLLDCAAMARILLFSDSHGVPAALRALRARVAADAPDLVCFLGDALYHGPRNGVPHDYDAKAAAEEFNAMAGRIVAVLRAARRPAPRNPPSCGRRNAPRRGPFLAGSPAERAGCDQTRGV